MPTYQRQVTDGGGHQDVGLAAARDEIARDVLVVADQVLCRCRLVIDVARIDIGAAVEKQLGNRDGRGDVQRRLSVAAAGVNRRWAFCEEPVERLEHAQLRGRVRVDLGPTLDQMGNEDRIRGVEHTKAAGPPAAANVDVRAGVQERVDHVAAPAPCRDEQRLLVERSARHRLVERRLHIRMTFKNRAHGAGIPRRHGR